MPGAIEDLFRHLDAVLTDKGYLAMGGQIIDATVVAAPKQKLTADEKAVIKQGDTPAGWSKVKRRKKDRDARWTLKRGVPSRSRKPVTAPLECRSRSRCRYSATNRISTSTGDTG
jgi:hypothetical protein